MFGNLLDGLLDLDNILQDGFSPLLNEFILLFLSVDFLLSYVWIPAIPFAVDPLAFPNYLLFGVWIDGYEKSFTVLLAI